MGYRSPGVFVTTKIEGGASSYPSSNHSVLVIGELYHVEDKAAVDKSHYYTGVQLSNIAYPNLPDTNKGDAKIEVDINNAEFAPIVHIRSEEGVEVQLPDSVCSFTAVNFTIQGNLRYNSSTKQYDASGDRELRGTITVSYRALSDKYSGSNSKVLNLSGEGDIVSVLGNVSTSNPVALGASIAMGEAQKQIKVICIGNATDIKGEDQYKSNPTKEDLRSWYQIALDKAAEDPDVGYIAMLTDEQFAKGILKAHVESMSAAEGKSERRGIVVSDVSVEDKFFVGDGFFHVPVGSDSTTKSTEISNEDALSLVNTADSVNTAVNVLAGELVRASGVVTSTGTIPHGLSVGDYVFVQNTGAATDSMDGVHKVTVVTDANTYQFNQVGADEASATDGTFIKCTLIKQVTVQPDHQTYNKRSLVGATALSWANTTLTVTFPSAHGAEVGDEIQLADFTNPIFNGKFKVATVPDSTHLTVEGADQGAGPTLGASTGTYQILTKHYFLEGGIIALQQSNGDLKYYNETTNTQITGALTYINPTGSVDLNELTRQVKLTDPEIDNFLAPGYQQYKKGNEIEFADGVTYTVKTVNQNYLLLEFDGEAGSAYSAWNKNAPYQHFYSATRFRTVDGEKDSIADKQLLAEGLKAQGEAIGSERIVNLVPGVVYDTVSEKDVPAYYLACAVIGEASRKDPGEDVGVDGYPRFTQSKESVFHSRGFFKSEQITLIASGGNMVMENFRDGDPLESHHTLTTDMSNEEKQEFSLGNARDFVAKRTRGAVKALLKKERIGTNQFGNSLKLNLGDVISYVEANNIMKSLKLTEVKQNSAQGSNTSVTIKIEGIHLYPFNNADVEITTRQPVELTIAI